MFSRTSEYALRAVLWLARHPEHSYAVHQIAHETEIPRGYLAKVLQSLARVGMLLSQPGPHGGYRIAETTSRATLLDIVHAIDPAERILGTGRSETPIDIADESLTARLRTAIRRFEDELRSITIGEMVIEAERVRDARQMETPIGRNGGDTYSRYGAPQPTSRV